MKSKLLLSSALFLCGALSIQNIYADYCTDFSTSTRTYEDRCLNSLNVSSYNGEEETSVPIPINQSELSGATVYFDMTSYAIETIAGESVTLSPDWSGNYMNGYLFIDYNNDGAFDNTLNADGTTDGELVSYSYYLDENSLGASVTGGEGPTPPPFNIAKSIAAGEYRARFMIDWNNIEPCSVGSYANAPAVVDFTVSIISTEISYTITINNDNEGWILDWEENFDTGEINEEYWTKTYEKQGGNADWSMNISTYEGCFDFDEKNIILKGIENPGYDITGDTRDYICGGIYSSGKKSFMRGKLEVCAKTTSARGAWPAIWLIPENTTGGWPTYGEIDMFEHLNYDGLVYQTLHTDYTYNITTTDPASAATPLVDVSEFNTYGIIMAADKLQVTLNGEVTIDYPNLEITEPYIQFPFDKEFYLIMDMQLGGSWVGDVTGNGIPVEMTIDWVRWYLPVASGGSITLYSNGEEVSSGTRVLEGEIMDIVVDVNNGFTLETLMVNGVDVSTEYISNGGYSFTASSNTEISATYNEITHTVTYIIDGDGSATIEDSTGSAITSGDSVSDNTDIVIEFERRYFNNLISYTVNGVDRSGYISNYSDEISITEDTEIEILFSGSTLGIESETLEYCNAFTNNDGIIINVSAPADITIYNINGVVVSQSKVEDTTVIPVASGIYIVKIGDRFFKVAKR